MRIEGEGSSRSVSLAGFGAWERKLARFREIEAFLEANGWDGAQCIAIRGDASARLFSRLERGANVVMLMDWPPVSDGPPIRDGRPYCQIAHLARKGAPFIAVSDWLRLKAGLSAPEVAAFDLDRGLFLVEDLGDAVFGTLIADGEALDPLYALAVDGLLAIRASKPPRDLPMAHAASYRVPGFRPRGAGGRVGPAPAMVFQAVSGARRVRDAFSHIFRSVVALSRLAWEAGEGPHPQGLSFAQPSSCAGSGAVWRRLGVIDFQDAVWGHPAYDLVSLLQDARLEVPEESERALYARYCEGAAKADPRFRSPTPSRKPTRSLAHSGTPRSSAFSRGCRCATASMAILHICHASSAICSATSPTPISSRFEHGMKPTFVPPWTPALEAGGGPEKVGPDMETADNGPINTAMVLAAGFGTRMRPLTDRVPKPLVELAGRALLDHALDRLAEAGIERAVVNVHHFADQIEAHLRGRTAPRIIISDERQCILETGGGVRKALPHLGREPFIVHNSDSVWSEGAHSNLKMLMDAWDPERMNGSSVAGAARREHRLRWARGFPQGRRRSS